MKLYVAFHAVSGQPHHVVETLGSRHNRPVGEELKDSATILVQDSCVRKNGTICRFVSRGRGHEIRLINRTGRKSFFMDKETVTTKKK